MTGEFSSGWLALREPADAAARSPELAGMLRDLFAGATAPLVIRDLGCGTGSLGRWLAPRLPYAQHWILMDRDPALLAHARAALPDGVTAETRQGDVSDLTAADLAGTSLLACSALLDLFTAGQVDALAAACAASRTPALFTLSVTGQVTFEPADERDPEIEAAFNAHQRRDARLGPDAGEYAAGAFRRAGAEVTVRATPWRLEPGDPLTSPWLRGWLDAAAEERPDLRLDDYTAGRDTHRPRVTVGHVDLLARF